MMNLVGEAENYKGSNYALDCVLPTAFQSLMAFSFGVYFGFVYLRVNNLFACIIMHALFDFLISIMGLFEKEGVNVDPLFSTLFPSMLLIFEAIGELSISYFIFKRTQCDKINLIFNIKK
jgi:membrane protease YdiL (CAAX protease family)